MNSSSFENKKMNFYNPISPNALPLKVLLPSSSKMALLPPDRPYPALWFKLQLPILNLESDERYIFASYMLFPPP